MIKVTWWSLLVSLFIVLTGGSALAGIAKNLSPVEAYQLLKERGDVYLLDVRTAGEFREVRLDGAKLIPIDQLLRRMQEVPRTRPVLVYCAVGSRSSQVVGYMARIGFPEVYNLYGGIYAWGKKGLPVLNGLP
jgi:rhodanese-related sulfurtransferase